MATYLEITQAHHDTLVAQARSAQPLEACGLMAGNGHRVQHVYPIDNIRKSPIEYEMDPTEQLKAMLDLEERGLELLAIYHSHPHGPTVPSVMDVAQAYYPEAAYVIVSLLEQQQPTIRAFKIVSGNVAEIPLRVV